MEILQLFKLDGVVIHQQALEEVGIDQLEDNNKFKEGFMDRK